MCRLSFYQRIGVLIGLVMVLVGCQQAAYTVSTPTSADSVSTPVVTGTLAGVIEKATVEPTAGQTLPFETLSNSSSLTAEQETPLLLLARSESELSAITTQLDNPDSLADVADVDLSNGLVVAIFRGVTYSSGYGITIQNVQLLDDQVEIFVELTGPQADRASSSVISYPYHIVQLSSNSIGTQTDLFWTVRASDGTILVTTHSP